MRLLLAFFMAVPWVQAAPTNAQVWRRGVGHCNGTSCTVPLNQNTSPALFPSARFVARNSEFCVFDPAMLP